MTSVVDCDFDNPALTCPRCKFDVGKIGGKADWRKNCPLGDGLPHPGTQLRILIDAMEIKRAVTCGCAEYERKMNAWGVAKCRERKPEIVARLLEESGATATELPFGLDLADLLGELVDEAIRLAEAAG